MSVLYIRALILLCVKSALLSFHFGNFCFHSVCPGKRSLLFPDQAGNSFFFSFSTMLQYSVLFWVLSVCCLFVLSPIAVTGGGGDFIILFFMERLFSFRFLIGPKMDVVTLLVQHHFTSCPAVYGFDHFILSGMRVLWHRFCYFFFCFVLLFLKIF